LPLIEAAQYGLPIIARDLPVFHEVAGEHAFYFSGHSAEALAARIDAWFVLYEKKEAPLSKNMPWLTWSASAQQLVDKLTQQQWYRHLPHRSV
jgi:glycosyltransferase involved in cell wall biosynthesis